MYQAPRLERFGTFRELTQQWWKNNAAAGKNIIGDDLIPGIGLDCNANAPPGDPTGCIRS
jgi:hypothetical protein